MAAVRKSDLDAASEVLTKAISDGQVDAASLYVRHAGEEFTESFGAAKSADDVFLIASISKPMSVAAVMTLYDQGEFHLDDRVQKFIPEFTGDGKSEVTVQQLLTHVSGLPDQLPENESLRRSHADLSQFVAGAIETPLLFPPDSRYSYSSMAILLASEIARRISGIPFEALIDQAVFQQLDMKLSALGLGNLKLKETMQCQVKNAAPESGAGDVDSKSWDWNSPFWRNLGAPWGGAHASAPDVGRFLADFLGMTGKVLRPQTARLMIENQNRQGLRPRGLGFEVGTKSASPGCSESTFGHSGATGTLAWADPATDTICVVLTTLPSTAANPHPRRLCSDFVAKAVAS